jgi:hypothetical protein
MAYDIARSGHNAGYNFLVSYKLKSRKDLNIGRGVLSHYNKRLFIIQIGGDEAIKFLGLIKSGVFGRGIQRNYNINILEF